MSDFLANLWSKSRGEPARIWPRVPSRFDPPATNLQGGGPVPAEIETEHESPSEGLASTRPSEMISPASRRETIAPPWNPKHEPQPFVPERRSPVSPSQRVEDAFVPDVQRPQAPADVHPPNTHQPSPPAHDSAGREAPPVNPTPPVAPRIGQRATETSSASPINVPAPFSLAEAGPKESRPNPSSPVEEPQKRLEKPIRGASPVRQRRTLRGDSSRSRCTQQSRKL